MKDLTKLAKEQHVYELLNIRHYLQCNLLGTMDEMLKHIGDDKFDNIRNKFEKERIESAIAYLDHQYEIVVGEKYNQNEFYEKILR